MIDQETLYLFDKLYYATYQDVLKYVVCHCFNIENVKDIVQNVYLEVFKILKRNPSYPIDKAYILGIAKHKVKDYYRFHYKAKFVSIFSSKDIHEDKMLIDTIPTDMNIENDLINKENLKFIWNFLKKKKDIIAKVFYLYYYMGLDIKEIAKELEISDAHVKNYLYRTLKELQVLMKNGGE